MSNGKNIYHSGNRPASGTLDIKASALLDNARVHFWPLGTVCFRSRCFFCIFSFHVTSGVYLKGMIESSLLSKDEPLNPNIDEVMMV